MTIFEQYLSYLIVITGRSENTILEYRTDLLMFFSFIIDSLKFPIINTNFSFADLLFVKSINLNEMYAFIAHCQTTQRASAVTRVKKIVSII